VLLAWTQAGSLRSLPDIRPSADPRTHRGMCVGFGAMLGPGRYGLRVATWDADAETTHPVDFRLVRNTFVTMFWRSSLLDETVGWLQSHAYRVVEFDAGSWSSDADMYDDVALALGFPDYFGRNLDALNDCMSDVASGDYGWDAGVNTGVVIVLRAFDAFTAVDRRTAQKMLHIFADQARSAILIGHRIICLVQSDDPRLTFEPVGAMPVMWNDDEWSNSRRDL
jgi:RNAse (barnase) inhibitor barstar